VPGIVQGSANAGGVSQLGDEETMKDPRAMADDLTVIAGDASRVLTAPAVVERLSKDFYWYSPVLRPVLERKRADVVMQPLSVDEVREVLRYCYRHDVPVTARGAGTGNYGQAIPLDGGVVLDMSRMERIEEIAADGVGVCEPAFWRAQRGSMGGSCGAIRARL